QVRAHHHDIHPTTSDSRLVLLVSALQHSAESCIFRLCARSSDATRPRSQAFLLSPPTSKTIIAFLATTCNCARLQSTSAYSSPTTNFPCVGTFLYLRLGKYRQSAARLRSPSARSFTPRADSAPPSVLLEPSPLRHAIAIHLIHTCTLPRFCARCGLPHGRRSRPVSVPQYPMLLARSSRPCTLRRQRVFAWMS
ncbi:hypothetical protein B0H13DRAFT_2013768, partial [Mycena leptocephala]